MPKRSTLRAPFFDNKNQEFVMKLSFSAAKKVMAAVLMGALYAPCIGAATAPSCDSAYVLEFARKYSDHVEYLHDERGVNKLILYANPRALDIVVKIISGLFAGGVGTAFLHHGINGVDGRNRKVDIFNRALYGVIGAGVAGLGLYAFFNGLNDCLMKSKKIPYITLDSECLLFWNGKRIWWCDVEHIAISSEQETNTTNVQWGNTGISTSHEKTTTTRTLHLVDKYNSDLFLHSEHDCYLPITFEQFFSILDHYVATYGSLRAR
jgi:hypothetical protein